MTQINMDFEFDEQLIDCVRAFPALWEMGRKSYKDKIAKDNAWRKVSETLTCDEEFCRKRWRNIRDAYKKSKKKTTTGSAATKLKYNDNDRLIFLDASLAERDSHCTVEYDDDQGENGISVEEQRVNIDTCDSSPSNANECDDKASFSSASNDKIRHQVPLQEIQLVEKNKQDNNEFDLSADSVDDPSEGKSSKRFKRYNKPKLNHTLNDLTKNQEKRFQIIKGLITDEKKAEVETKPRHPIFTFFESLAETVSQLPPDLIARTRSQVAQIVTDMELEGFERSNTRYNVIVLSSNETSTRSTSNCHSVVASECTVSDSINSPERLNSAKVISETSYANLQSLENVTKHPINQTTGEALQDSINLINGSQLS